MQKKQELVSKVAKDCSLQENQVAAVIELIQDGNTVPFIARYRKEKTDSLDEVQIRAIRDRHIYLLELEERRQTILNSIADQGKLSTELEKQILAADTKSTLEDLYLPFRPKRRTRATQAREKGLEPLADLILAQADGGDVKHLANSYVDPEKSVNTLEEALAGARDIVAEVISEKAEIRAFVRNWFSTKSVLTAKAQKEWQDKPSKYKQYYDYSTPIGTVRSHQYLAVRRGEKEKVLRVRLEVDQDNILDQLVTMTAYNPHSCFADSLKDALEDSYQRLLEHSVEAEVRVSLKEKSDHKAVQVFAENLHNVLMAAPLGEKPVIGIDPGIRTGCKCTVLDQTGKFLHSDTIYLNRSQNEVETAKDKLVTMVNEFSPKAIAVGNGTYGRETETFVRKCFTDHDNPPTVVMVNEAGASVYSASDIARLEFPDLDLTLRGAISIGRRLQDPLAELVKIDPKSIGVGQYQHDVYQSLLTQKLDEVVESCVNSVGVELNTASAALLSRVSGLRPSVANNIVKHREQQGAFNNRQELLKVSGLGPKAFEQAAGFLRIRNGSHPLDASAVHPERYPVVERMAKDLKLELDQLVGDSQRIKSIDPKRYVDEEIGLPTLKDILEELDKPGRDPRSQFESPKFNEDICSIDDLLPGMQLEGVVTNVTAFGAFVDIGVHRDGLVHISELADHFVKDPSQLVRVGDRLQVRVITVDHELGRISLSARKDTKPKAAKSSPQKKKPQATKKESFTYNPFSNLKK
jgi:uncharacterized protein